MTELHIERKERNVWPWVIGALALAILAWFFLSRGDGDTTIGAADTTAAVVATASGGETETDGTPAAVSEFVRFAGQPASGDANRMHEYTAEGLRKLADALTVIVERGGAPGVDVRQRIATIRGRADSLQRNPTSNEHALEAREAFLLASALLLQMPRSAESAIASQLRDVNDAASNVRANQPLLEQTTQVHRFFDLAARAIQDMARTS